MTAPTPESMLSKEDFEKLPVPEKLDVLYEGLKPLNDLYVKSIIIQRFGVGLGGILFSIIIVGEAIIKIISFSAKHFFH